MTKWFTVFVLLVGCSTGSLRSSAKFSLDGVDEEVKKWPDSFDAKRYEPSLFFRFNDGEYGGNR